MTAELSKHVPLVRSCFTVLKINFQHELEEIHWTQKKHLPVSCRQKVFKPINC